MAKLRFNDLVVRKLSAPKGTRLDFADELCSCLHLRVTGNGTKTWSAMVRVNGRLQRRTIGRYPQVGLKEARDATLAMLRKAGDGIDPRQPPRPAAAGVTYQELVEKYWSLHLKPNTRSARDIRGSLLHSVLRHLLTRPVDGIAKQEILEPIDGLVADGNPQAAVNVLRRLKMLFNWACDRDLVGANPCDRIRPPVKTVERDRVLADVEIAAIWQASFDLPAPYGQMYRMLMLTGQRRSEVATMRWSEIDDDVWTIPREKVKKDRPHAVPLPPAARDVLNSLPKFSENGYIFSTTGGKSASSNFAKVKQQMDRLSGVKDWRLHDIRRTVRSKLAELGVPREVARKILNHEEGKVDRTYNRYEYLDEKRRALELWAKHLSTIARQT